MKKRIYRNVIGLLLLCIVLLSSAISSIFYNVTKKQEIAAVKNTGVLIAELLNQGKNFGAFTDYISDQTDAARITVIAPDGTVLLDNKTIADKLENHKDRIEFEQALTTGVGEATRFSNTLDSATYYYAIKLHDGNVLRMSKTISSITQIYTAVLPVILLISALIFLFANFIVRKLTSNIIKPINEIDLENSITPVYDELSPFAKKIDQQRKEISEQFSILEHRANTIKAIMENMKEGLVLIDTKGTILSANTSALKIWNQDMADKNILHICRNMDLLQKIKDCLSGHSSEMVFERDGKYYSVFLNPVSSGGTINGAIILFLDTTERYKAEIQRKEFSANVSHELKTPLTTISALSEMIENGMAKDADIKEFAAKISGQAKRLINIIEDIIKLSEFDEGDIQREFAKIDLRELAVSVSDSLQEKAAEKNVNIKVTGEHILLVANRRMIDQLLYNLIENAIKYNKNGGMVTISLDAVDDYCKIKITDTGIGIPKEHQSRVFERFYRVDKSRSQKTGGTGLGLSIVKHIVEYHKGRIEIESGTDGIVIVCYLKNTY